MTAPSKLVRNWTYLRDGFVCISCGSFDLTWQHRESSGHGGRGSKAPVLRTCDGVTLCLICNQACEAEMQDKALALGWKIRRNRGGIPAFNIPFYDVGHRTWFLPTAGVQDGPWRVEISAERAEELLRAAGSLTKGHV